MGAVSKVVDVALFIFFLFVSVIVPLLDAQIVLPGHLYPSILVEIKSWYAREYSDYLVYEKPHFFVGLVWLELLFQWPLAFVSAYGIAARKSWVNTTCLLTGASTLTSMVAILFELALSNKASNQLLIAYSPFLVFSLLALLRGLLAQSGKSVTRKSPVLNEKKRA